MASKFEIFIDKKGEYRFRYKAGNGQVVATGQGYASKEGCLKGIKSIQENSAGATIVEVETEE